MVIVALSVFLSFLFLPSVLPSHLPHTVSGFSPEDT